MNISKNNSIISQEFENYVIADIKTEISGSDEKIKEIYDNHKRMIEDDLKIIISQTNQDIYESYNLYKKNNFNLENSIINFLNPEFNFNKTKKVIESSIQKKISEIREIANHKDALYEINKR